MLEAQLHESSLFLTLTYDKENYPDDGCVRVRELQLFLKRVRKALEPVRVRFFGVGEYGEHTGRAHYHVILFGVPVGFDVRPFWKKGFVHVGSVTKESAGYIAKYTLKRMTRDGDERLRGKTPEFARMSLRPGIGAGAVEKMRDALVSDEGEVFGGGVVPGVVRQEGRQFPLGRYLKGRLYDRVGLSARRVFDRMVAARIRADRLSTVEAREVEEGKRVQQGRNAAARCGIMRGKKGL